MCLACDLFSKQRRRLSYSEWPLMPPEISMQKLPLIHCNYLLSPVVMLREYTVAQMVPLIPNSITTITRLRCSCTSEELSKSLRRDWRAWKSSSSTDMAWGESDQLHTAYAIRLGVWFLTQGLSPETVLEHEEISFLAWTLEFQRLQAGATYKTQVWWVLKNSVKFSIWRNANKAKPTLPCLPLFDSVCCEHAFLGAPPTLRAFLTFP